jgi:hypothetical protein
LRSATEQALLQQTWQCIQPQQQQQQQQHYGPGGPGLDGSPRSNMLSPCSSIGGAHSTRQQQFSAAGSAGGAAAAGGSPTSVKVAASALLADGSLTGSPFVQQGHVSSSSSSSHLQAALRLQQGVTSLTHSLQQGVMSLTLSLTHQEAIWCPRKRPVLLVRA